MRIESALFTSKEGLNSHGQAIAVMGDNISNANTVGYKASRVEFADLLAEGGEGRKSTTHPLGGSGVQVSRVRQVHDTGVLDYTSRSLDAAIAGNGFFVVGSSSDPYYTRAGNFSVDEQGLLINSAGQHVLGYTGTANTLGTLNVLDLDLSGTPTSEATIHGNLSTTEEVAELVPTNPESYQQIGKYANYISSLTVYDSLGVSHDVTLAYFKTDTGTFTVQAYVNADEVGGTAGVPAQIGQNATLTFGTDGKIAEANQAAAIITATPNYSNGAAQGNFTIDLSAFTQFGGSTIISAITQDGEGTGNIDDYEIRRDGGLYAKLDSGASVLIGHIPLATFPNVDALERAGNTLFSATETAGQAELGKGGTGSRGDVEGGSLELSTVDIANQFVNIVVYQRGYQANSQVLNATNGIIRDTLGLVR